jgi:hypothetical protein
VDPSNANILYAGGIGLWRFDGTNWTEIDSVANGIHVDQHSLGFAGARLIAGNDGGVWSTTDSGANWNDHNTTLSTIQFFEGSLHPTDANFVLGASQDNGTEKWTGTPAWNFVFGGDGADNAISSSAPNTNWAVSFQGQNIQRTKDGGASFIPADSGINKTNAPFIAKFEKCQANDDVFIAGTANVWRTNSFFSAVGSPSWLSNGPTLGAGISAMAFAPSDTSCNTYAVGTSSGQLRLTSNGGSTWSDVHGSGSNLPNRSVTDLAFDPLDASILWVTFSGFDEGTPSQPGHVFGGVTVLTNPIWVNLSPPANLPFNAIVVDPGNHNNLYAASDIGVWKTTDAANSWTHMGPQVGMPNVAVFELQLNDATNRVVAFTHGRGALTLTFTGHPIEPLASPQRLVDTRTSGGPIAVGTSRCFQIAGQGGIPADAAAAVLNVTAVTYAANGYLTLYPNGQSVPGTSTLNFDTNEYAIANGAVIRIGTGGQVCVFAGQAGSNVVLDATGYVPSAGAAQLPLLTSPQRLVDTRTSGGPIAAGTSRCFQIAGQGGIPVDATAAVLNVTAVTYTANGWLTLYPNGQSVPSTSTLNFDTNEWSIANGAVIRIGNSGQVCVNAGRAASNVILDGTGYLTSAGAARLPQLTSPQRLVDTRSSGGPIPADTSRCFQIAGQGGIPANAFVALLNVTGVTYTAIGWLTLYPNGQSLPATSTLNFDPHEWSIANGSIISIGAGGQVCVNAGRSASDVVIDATGYELP